MPRPNKVSGAQMDMQLDGTMPIPVKVINDPKPNPWAGKYPKESDPVEKRNYRFIYNQNPGTPLECTPGRSVIKGNGMPGTVHEKWCLEDDNVYELPVWLAKHLNSLLYFDQGQKRPRCSCIEVD